MIFVSIWALLYSLQAQLRHLSKQSWRQNTGLEEQQIRYLLFLGFLGWIFLIVPLLETKPLFYIFIWFVCKFHMFLKFPRDDAVPDLLFPFSLAWELICARNTNFCYFRAMWSVPPKSVFRNISVLSLFPTHFPALLWCQSKQSPWVLEEFSIPLATSTLLSWHL